VRRNKQRAACDFSREVGNRVGLTRIVAVPKKVPQ
jgi:hypothetical protein